MSAHTVERFNQTVLQLLTIGAPARPPSDAEVTIAIERATKICDAEIALEKKFSDAVRTDVAVRAAVRAVASQGREASDATFAMLKAYFEEE